MHLSGMAIGGGAGAGAFWLTYQLLGAGYGAHTMWRSALGAEGRDTSTNWKLQEIARAYFFAMRGLSSMGQPVHPAHGSRGPDLLFGDAGHEPTQWTFCLRRPGGCLCPDHFGDNSLQGTKPKGTGRFVT